MRYTLGPWDWLVQGDRIWLAAMHSGLLTIMDFVRKGMSGAQPRFAVRNEKDRGGLMHKADELDLAKHPDAVLIQNAPDYALLLQAISMGLADVEKWPSPSTCFEIACNGLRHVCEQDLLELPQLTDGLRKHLHELVSAKENAHADRR